MCEKERNKRVTCVEKSGKKELLHENINPTKLSEMINNSIKEAVQIIAKQCSMVPKMQEEEPTSSYSKGPEKKSRECRSYMVEEHCKKSPDVCNNREKTYHVTRQYNNVFTYGNSNPCSKTHEIAMPLPMENKNNSDKKNKKHSKPASNVNADNRRMTGNVNIYICSEANDNSQAKGKQKLKPQYCTDTSSDTITGQSNSRCVSASSVSSCRLINSIQEKRKKLQASRLPNFVQDKNDRISDSSGDSNKALSRTRRTESSESNKEQTDVKVTDEDVECKDTTASSTRDGCCCKDTSFGSTNLRQDFDNSRYSTSWIRVYPSETRAKLNDDSDVSLSNAICINAERRNYYKNNPCNDICRYDSECTVCDAIDSSNWLPKSIYADCATYDKIAKDCFAEGDDRKYRNNELQDPIINRSDMRKKQVGNMRLQRSPGNCQREHVARQWSACTCIAEEEEDCCTNVDRIESELLENSYNDAKRAEKISVCEISSSKLADNAIVCVTSLNNAGEHSGKTETCNSTFGNLVECPEDAIVCGTTLENSKETPKVTRVCKKKFVAEEPSQGITVCRTIFAEQKGTPEEVTVCKIMLPDSKETPKETVCKISDSNFIEQDNTKTTFLNDENDKSMKEKRNNSNLNNQKRNAINAKGVIIQSNSKYNSEASNNFTEQNFIKDVKQDDEIRENVSNNQSKIPTVSVGSIKDVKSLSENMYFTTLPRVDLHNRSNLASNRNAKEAPKIFDDSRRTVRMQLSPFYRPTKSRFQQLSKVPKGLTTRDLASSKSDQTEEKTQEKSQDENEKEETGMVTEKPKDISLYQSFKKLIDVIRRNKTHYKDRIETEDKKDVVKVPNAPETEDKIIGEKDHRDISKNTHAPMSSQLANEQEIIRNALHVGRQKSTAPVTEFTVSEDQKIDIPSMDQAADTRFKPKLLRIIAAKRMHLQRTEKKTEPKSQKPEMESVPAEVIINGHVDQEETPQETISPEVTEEVKAEKPVVPKISVTKVEDIPQDVADSSRDITDKNGVIKDPIDKRTEFYVSCLQEKSEEESRKIIPCKCGVSFDSRSCFCIVAKCAKCNNTLEDCLCKDNGLQQKEICCAHQCLLTAQCTCAPTQYLKNSSRTDKPKFRNASPSKNSCMDCCRIREECKCRKTVVCVRCCRSHEECRCRRCAMRSNYLKYVDVKCRYKPPANCVNCYRQRDECCCATSALVKCYRIKRGCSCKKAMICLYCDNPQDKCTCRAPIGKCSYCGLPSDVCNCQDDKNHDRDRKQVIGRPNENRTIQVTSWKPKREIRRYFARHFEDVRSMDVTEECRCHEKLKRQRPEELPYQRLNVFSNVMNELQQKMSESVCCTRCGRNPCSCGSQVISNERNGESKIKGYNRRPEMEKPRSRSPSNRQCNSSPKNEYENTVQNSLPIRHIDCICKISPCRCKRNRATYRRPLAKCYYCKSLPCT